MVDPLTTAAISWSFASAGWLISPVLSRFLNKCCDALDIDPEFKSRKTKLREKLKNLETTLLPQLLILTDAAEQSPHRHLLDKWLQSLKSAFYETEHVLGLVEYRRLEKEVNSHFPSTSQPILKKLKKKLKRKFAREKKKLIKSLEDLKKVVNEGVVNFVHLLTLPSSSGNSSTQISNEQYRPREAISTPDSTVIGREKDRDDIVKLLWEDFSESTSNAKSYSVIGIWGMGGSGKTTLAQYVCEHEKKVKYFDCVMWVYVSEKFNVRAIMEKMWESVSDSGSSCPDYKNLDVLITQLAAKLRGKKYLLVLDDVWCEKGVSEQQINQIFAPLRDGKRGSKILVTTRNEEAARALGAMNLIKMPELADEDFLSLFMSHALRDVEENMKKGLRAIGEKIVGKLCRLPLAAITVAGLLRRNPNHEFWSSMLNKNLLNDTMGSLFLSYQHLPPALQRCFAFCSLFPKGRKLERDLLVNLWIAEGFIETEDGNEHMKDIGNRYILELISSSFFQVCPNWDGKHYSMHDLIHDLAQYVSEGEYFRIESGENKEIPAHTRHIFVQSKMFRKYVEKICELKDLRTIIVSDLNDDVFLKEGDLDALFRKLRKLYVVEIKGISPDVKRVPKSLFQLRNLRYFNLRNSNSEYLNLDAHSELLCYQLRFLDIQRWFDPIPNVGRLRSLIQELGRFVVRMERGFELKQLEHLKDLYGSLLISGLNNVKSKEEADEAKLYDKKGLRRLLLQWDYNGRDVLRDNDEKVLDGLCPPPQIKELTIKNYSGKMFPSWILENNDHVSHLQLLELRLCNGLEALHRINELSDLLSLTICYLPRLKSWVSLPLNLTQLEISNCDGLEALTRINELSDLLSLTIRYLPRLKSWVPLPLNITQLEISNCFPLVFAVKEDLDMIMSTKGTRISQIVTFMEMMNNLNYFSVHHQFAEVQKMIEYGDDIEEETLISTISEDLNKCLEKRLDLICQLKDVYGEPFLPPALESLHIESCFITDKILAGSLHGLTSLTHLTLKDIIIITCIPKEVLNSLTNLLNLKIHRCLLLTSIGGLDTHSTLEKLDIKTCPNLTTFETSLEVASYSDTIELTSSSRRRRTRSNTLKWVGLSGCMLSDDMLQGLISPETLSVSGIPTMVNLHIGHFKALIHVLALEDCPNLASLRGLNELTNLEYLIVLFGCDKLKCYSDADKLPQLKKLRINRFSLLEQLVSRDGFSSLDSLELDNAQQECLSQEESDQMFRYLSSLTKLSFRFCKMRSLPNLMCLHSRIDLEITGCENLSSLPYVPPSVKSILIGSCNEEFTRSCKDPNHPNWHKISHIRHKFIH